MENLTGQSLKGYELLDRIGSGGFGVIYQAYQSTIGREVAVKVILPRFANQPEIHIVSRHRAERRGARREPDARVRARQTDRTSTGRADSRDQQRIRPSRKD